MGAPPAAWSTPGAGAVKCRREGWGIRSAHRNGDEGVGVRPKRVIQAITHRPGICYHGRDIFRRTMVCTVAPGPAANETINKGLSKRWTASNFPQSHVTTRFTSATWRPSPIGCHGDRGPYAPGSLGAAGGLCGALLERSVEPSRPYDVYTAGIVTPKRAHRVRSR